MQFKELSHILRVVLSGALLALLLVGCSVLGKQQVFELGWKRAAIFPAAVGVYETANGMVEPILYNLLHTGAQDVLNVDKVKQALENNATRKEIYEKYLSLLSVLNFSDDKMSKQLGEILGCDYFLFASVKEWGYYREEKHEYAHVTLKLMAVEAASGKIIWQENRSLREMVLLRRPSLNGMAGKLLEDILTARRQKR